MLKKKWFVNLFNSDGVDGVYLVEGSLVVTTLISTKNTKSSIHHCYWSTLMQSNLSVQTTIA